jgi:hypothetical protein
MDTGRMSYAAWDSKNGLIDIFHDVGDVPEYKTKAFHGPKLRLGVKKYPLDRLPPGERSAELIASETLVQRRGEQY